MRQGQSESERKREKEKWQTCCYCRGQQRAKLRRLQKKVRTHWASRTGKGGLSFTESSWQECRSLFSKKKKEQSHPPKSQDRVEEKIKMGKSRTLVRKKEIRAKTWSTKSGLHNEGKWVLGRSGKASRERASWRKRRQHER